MNTFRIAALCLSLWSTFALAGLENPAADSTQSGIGLISGWVCGPATVAYAIDGGSQVAIPFGSARADTASSCGGQSNNGFGLLFNFNTLAVGKHTLRVFANGTQLGQTTFTATNTGGEFQQGLIARRYLENFPGPGVRTIVEWQEAKQNFSIIGTDTSQPPITGNYLGGLMLSRSGCPVNGLSNETGTLQASLSATGVATITTQTQSGTCTVRGNLFYYLDGGQLTMPQGTVSCTDGSSGTIVVPNAYITPQGFTFDFTEHFGGCTVSGRGGGLRQ